MSFIETEIFKLKNAFDLVLEKEAVETICPEEYLCKTIVTAISPGTEMAAYAGVEPLRPGNIYPRVVGYCNIAEVIKIGENISDINIGDWLLTFQSHRSVFKQNIKDFKLIVSKNIKPEHAVTAYLFHLGLHAAQTGEVRAGHYVAIIGMGTLGFTTSLICNLSNVNTTVFSNIPSSTFKKQDGINYFSKKDFQREELGILTNNTGFDIIINTSNKWDDWKLALELCRKGGTIVNLGFPGRGEKLPNFNPLDPKYVYFKNIQIKPLGHISESDVPPFEYRFNMKRNLEYILYSIQNGKLSPDMIISEIVPYTGLKEQYIKYLNKTQTIFTTILDWRDNTL
jgi:threonine dehydrogenase-like Zn-dependent dehydrogenase